MNTFISIMLIIILILIISDVFFLWRILKNISKKKKYLPDEKYFELKYNINLLKAVSAILIFLVGFLGFNSYNNISDNLEQGFAKTFEGQNAKIDSLWNVVSVYEKSIELLKMEEGESVKNIGEINRSFKIINEKIKKSQEALRYTTKIYVINNLKFPTQKFDSPANNRREAFTIYFKDLKTIYNEKLPKFKSNPMVILDGKAIILNVVETTKEYIKIDVLTRMDYDEEKAADFYYFDLWIAESN